jgi:hypothetical protein
VDTDRAGSCGERRRAEVASSRYDGGVLRRLAMRFPPAVLLIAILLVPSASADVGDTKSERALYLANADFKLIIPRDDWLITREQTRADGKSVYYSLSSLKHDMTLWFFLDQTPVCQNATACLELSLKNKIYDGAQDMKFAEQPPFKIAHFTLPGTEGTRSQQHLIAAAYVDGCWIDVHLIQPARESGSADLLAFMKLVTVK